MYANPTNRTVKNATRALDRVADAWLRRPGVTAVDVGFKITGDKLTDQVAVRAHVAKKVPVDQLRPEHVFNISDQGDESVDGFPVDVVEAEYHVADQVPEVGLVRSDPGADPESGPGRPAPSRIRRQRVRPLTGGISCGSQALGKSGTLGAVVFARRTGEPMILSNWHVLAGRTRAPIGAAILQPSLPDGAHQGDQVAVLSAAELNDRMDAAVARIGAGIEVETGAVGVGEIVGHETPRLGMLVTKSGRTTNVTKGVVDGVSLRTAIRYPSIGRRQEFRGQVHILPRPPWPEAESEISLGGDSGSIWINEATNRAIGLHFAGETNRAVTAENALANPLGPILGRFDVSFSPRPDRVAELCRVFPWLCAWIHRRHAP